MKRILSTAINVMRDNVGILRFPYKLTYATTYKCNQKCKICNIWKTKPTDEMQLNEIQMFFEKSNTFNWVDITGGEPTLRKDIVEIAETIIGSCRNLYLLHFPTNGFDTDRIVDICRRILEFKPRHFIVTVSVDGPDFINDQLRGAENSFAGSIETYSQLRKIQDRSFNVFFGTTISYYNHSCFTEMFDSINKIVAVRHSDFHINIANTSHHYYRNNDLTELDPAAALNFIDTHLQKARFPKTPASWLEKKYLELCGDFHSNGKSPVKCRCLNASCFMSPDGMVYPCISYDMPIANIKDYDYSLAKLLASDRAMQINERIAGGQCPQCWTACDAYPSILGNLFSIRRR